MVAAIAQWFRLRLPSCGPRFEFQAHHLCFFKKIEKNNFLIYQFTVGLYLFLKLRTKVDEVWNLHTREQVYLCDITHSVMTHVTYHIVYLCDITSMWMKYETFTRESKCIYVTTVSPDLAKFCNCVWLFLRVYLAQFWSYLSKILKLFGHIFIVFNGQYIKQIIF